MQNSRVQTIAARFNPSRLRTSFRNRSASAGSSASSSSSCCSSSTYSSPTSPSPASTINSVIFRQPSILNLEEERRVFSHELGVLEPRPIVYWGGVEERMGSLNF